MMKFGIIYDILLLNIARKFGLESEQVRNFIIAFENAKSNDEIQENYSKIFAETPWQKSKSML